MANDKFNGQNNGQQPQVRVENAPKASKNFLKSFVTSKAGKITMGILGAAALVGGGVWGYRRYQAKKAAAAQEPAPAAAEPTK